MEVLKNVISANNERYLSTLEFNEIRPISIPMRPCSDVILVGMEEISIGVGGVQNYDPALDRSVTIIK